MNKDVTMDYGLWIGKADLSMIMMIRISVENAGRLTYHASSFGGNLICGRRGKLPMPKRNRSDVVGQYLPPTLKTPIPTSRSFGIKVDNEQIAVEDAGRLTYRQNKL